MTATPRPQSAAVLASLAALLLAACSAGPPPPPQQDRSQAHTYAAVGASETVGVGSDDPLVDAWPQLLFRQSLPRGTVFVNLGIPGATVQEALRAEVPEAVQLQPDIVTVWLNVNDLIAGVPPAVYERQLADLVHQLRRGTAAAVLVANTPPLERLPAYLACRPNPPPGSRTCPQEARGLPGPDAVVAMVNAYNDAVARVVKAEGAVLVDLHGVALEARAGGTDAVLVSADGFHPSTAGHAEVAKAFAASLPAGLAARAKMTPP